jgi:tetratricopeptide (TPR) repeat protein
MRQTLAELLAPPGHDARARTVDADAAARLRSLGYASGAAPARTRPYGDDDDPKRLVGLNERFNDALQAFGDGRRDQALSAFEAILTSRPDFLTARTSAATVLISEQRADDAVRLLSAAPGAQATSPELLAKLGAAKREAGDLPGAVRALEASRAGGNENPDLLNDLGVVYARLGRAADARGVFDALLREAPHAAGTWYNLGLFEMSQHRADAAATAFRRAVESDPSYGEAWKALGAALAGRDPGAAADAWRRAEVLLPKDYDLLFNLGIILASSGRSAEALPYLDRFVREAPRDRYAADIASVRAVIAKGRQ